METRSQVSAGDVQHRNNTHTYPHAHKRWGLKQVSQLCLCFCGCQQGWGPDQSLYLAEIHLPIKVGQFYSSCQLRCYSILNFDVLLGLIADCGSIMHTLCSAACCTEFNRSKYSPEEQRGPSWTHLRVRNTKLIICVSNIRRSKPTATRKLRIITQILLKLEVLLPVNVITVATERTKTVELFQMFSPNIQTEGKH